MTAETDRAAALKAAIQDIARDLEADLAKLRRYRGTTVPSTAGISFTDPGPDLATYEKQKAAFPGRVEHTTASYRSALVQVADAVGRSTTGAAGTELVALITDICAIRNYDDAVALVATFEEN